MLKKVLVVLFVAIMAWTGIYMYQYEIDKQIVTKCAEDHFGNDDKMKVDIVSRDDEWICYIVSIDGVRTWCWAKR